MKIKVFGLIVLFVVSLVPVANSKQQAPCTNLGCINLLYMSQVLVNGTQGCVEFAQPTGRRVRNEFTQGGEISSDGGLQSISYSYTSCAVCEPPPLNSIAIEGTNAVQVPIDGYGTFGMYTCLNFEP